VTISCTISVDPRSAQATSGFPTPWG